MNINIFCPDCETNCYHFKKVPETERKNVVTCSCGYVFAYEVVVEVKVNYSKIKWEGFDE